METSFLKSAFSMAHIAFTENEPLSSKTTFKVGGNAELFVIPESISQFQSALAGSASSELPFFVLGGGSNVVFPDDTYHGIVISTQKLNSIIMTDNEYDDLPKGKVLVTCQAGCSTAAFVNFCTKHNLSGAEQFAGLPGTIGGAAYMNARCFEKSISDIIYSTEHLDLSVPTKSKLITQKIDPTQWAYKKSPFQDKITNEKLRTTYNKTYVTSVTFVLDQLTESSHVQIEENCKKYIAERVDKGHFKYPSAGSVFKNNHDFGAPSGKIIDEAGLRGYQIGGAQVAPFHGNFIINTGNAKSSEIKQLVEYIQKIVQEKTSFLLEPEIIFVSNTN